MIDPMTMQFQSFDSSHGLQNTDFNSGAYLGLSDGLFLSLGATMASMSLILSKSEPKIITCLKLR